MQSITTDEFHFILQFYSWGEEIEIILKNTGVSSKKSQHWSWFFSVLRFWMLGQEMETVSVKYYF